MINKDTIRNKKRVFLKLILIGVFICNVGDLSTAFAEDIALDTVQVGSVSTPIKENKETNSTNLNLNNLNDENIQKSLIPDEQKSQTLMDQYSKKGIVNYLPIRTPNLKPGMVSSKQIQNDAMIEPIFIIGCDEQSKSWLSQNLDKLQQLHAIGLLVQADTPDEVSTIQAIGKNLMIIPASANELISKYNLEHYPVLITKDGILQ